MSRLLVLRGLPASGKTTWAREWVAANDARVRVNRDDFRAMFYPTPDYGPYQEAAVTAAENATVKALLTAGRAVVVDNTHLRPKYVRAWRRLAAAMGADFAVREFPIDPDEAVARDAARLNPVGEPVIRRMAGKYLHDGKLLPIPDEPPDATPEAYKALPGTAPTVLVDLDGTLCLNKSGRDYYDLTRCGEDEPNWPVIEALLVAHSCGRRIVYLSGREDTARADTEAWLKRWVGIPGPLFMRQADDKRRDSIIKRELFDTYVRDHYDVRYVFDDRDQVVRMWRDLGLTVFQVAEGAF